MSEHTPGRWEYWPTKSGRIWIVAKRDTGPILCELRTSEADARLIAAAPELLAVVRHVKSEWLIADHDPLKTLIDSVIAKATGQAS